MHLYAMRIFLEPSELRDIDDPFGYTRCLKHPPTRSRLPLPLRLRVSASCGDLDRRTRFASVPSATGTGTDEVRIDAARGRRCNAINTASLSGRALGVVAINSSA